MKGVVKFFNESKGFGFIKVSNGKDVFFHKSALRKGDVVKDNDQVEFTLTHTERGDAAEQITKI